MPAFGGVGGSGFSPQMVSFFAHGTYPGDIEAVTYDPKKGVTSYTPSSGYQRRAQQDYLFAKATGGLASQLFPQYGSGGGLSPGIGTAYLRPEQLLALQQMQAAGQPVGALLPGESPFLPLQAAGFSIGQQRELGGQLSGFVSLDAMGESPFPGEMPASTSTLKTGFVIVGVIVVIALALGVRRSR